MINAILRLRRDNDYNYDKIKDSFIPANGEVCLVDTAREGLRAVCGDGKSTFGQLSYLGDVVQQGYYKEGIFYKDATYLQQMESYTSRLYINLENSNLYYYDGEIYKEFKGKLPVASTTTAGIMKLYETTGQNNDGTMSQKVITDELNTKVELTLKEEEELAIFSL